MRAFAILFRFGLAALLGAAAVRLGAKDGDLRKAVRLGGSIDASPALASDGTVYVGVYSQTQTSLGLMLAMNRDGSELWHFPKGNEFVGGISSSPALSRDEKTLYFGGEDGLLYALDAKTGNKLWSFRSASAPFFNSPTINPITGDIYIVSDDRILHALAPTGTERWSRTDGLTSPFDSAVATGQDGILYFGSNDANLYALNPDRSEKWHAALGASPTCLPAIGSDGTVYIGTIDNHLVAVSSEGVVKWKFPVGDFILASPSLAADGVIYFGAFDSKFYAVNPDGTIKWVKGIGANIASTAAVRADGTVIFGANDNLIRALDAAGNLKWTVKTEDVVASSPAIAQDGTIYVGSDDASLYIIDGSGSPLSTVSSWPMLHADLRHSGTVRPTTAGAYLVNLSTIAFAGGGSNLIVGFVVQGPAPKRFLIRGVGPTLGKVLNIPGVMADPALSLVYAPTAAEVAANNDWGSPDENFLQVNQSTKDTFALSAGEKDAAIAPLLVPGRYSAVLRSNDGGTGVALVEVYDTDRDSAGARLINLSTRAQSGSGASILTAGLVIGGQGTARVLVRAIGPGLLQFPNVTGVLARPMMRVFDSTQKEIARNTGWTSGGLTEDLAAAARMTGAFALTATGAGAPDSAMVLTLTPSNYTIQISGADGATGEALVEVYLIP